KGSPGRGGHRKKKTTGKKRGTNPPINARTGRKAKPDDSTSWASFDEALDFCRQGQADGIGFVFSPDDPFCGIDLDDCRDPDTGAIDEGANWLVAELNSYTEVSPSRTGLKVFLIGELPPGGNRKGHVEFYDRGRYFTVTAHQLNGTPPTVEARQPELAGLHSRLFTKTTSQATNNSTAL